MSPAQIVLLVVVMTVAAFGVARLTATTPTPEPKRFGLKEAENTIGYAERAVQAVGAFLTTDAAREAVKKATAQAMVGSAVGLGYENRVAEDLDTVSAVTASLNDGDRGKIEDNDQRIAELEATIRSLRAIVANREGELTKKKRIAALFTT